MERRQLELREKRIDRVRQAIAERILPVCSWMPEDEFDALVERMAEIEVKYTLRLEIENLHGF